MTHLRWMSCSCWDCLQAMRRVLPPLPGAERPRYIVPEQQSTLYDTRPTGAVTGVPAEPTLDLYTPTWRCPKGHEQSFAVAATYGTAAQHAPATAYCLTCFNEWAAERFPTSPVEREKTHG